MSMVIPLSLSQSAAHDVALVPWTNLSLLGFYQLAARSQKASVVAWFLFTAGSIALAMLTKGLIGIAITCVGTGLLLTVNWFLPSLHPNSSGRSGLYRTAFLCAAAVALGLCLASPWFIAVEVRSPGYLYYYFVERHVLGFATATQPHGQEPWYFYLPVLALGAMPWAAFVLPLVISETYRWYHKLRDRSVLFVICWLVGGLLFLSTAHSKLVTYALPLFPAVAILAAVSWRRFETRNIPQVARQLFRKLSFAIGVLGILLPVGTLICLQLLMHIHSPPAAYACSAALALYSALSLAFFHTGQYSRTISIAATWISGFAFLIITWPLQAISQAHSERDLAHWFNHQQHPPECLLMVGEQPYSVLFYLNPDLRECGTANNIQRSDLARLSSPESLRPGTVIAITQREQAIAHRQGVHIPGVLLSVEGQFSLYEIQQPTVSVAELNRKIFQ
jgi:4-amino-4-deoxy-L-arabinose transferase-like glycosyltransferase